jgi:hypothetical protein
VLGGGAPKAGSKPVGSSKSRSTIYQYPQKYTFTPSIDIVTDCLSSIQFLGGKEAKRIPVKYCILTTLRVIAGTPNFPRAASIAVDGLRALPKI